MIIGHKLTECDTVMICCVNWIWVYYHYIYWWYSYRYQDTINFLLCLWIVKVCLICMHCWTVSGMSFIHFNKSCLNHQLTFWTACVRLRACSTSEWPGSVVPPVSLLATTVTEIQNYKALIHSKMSASGSSMIKPQHLGIFFLLKI